jgi:hypothetical protein
LSGTSRSKDIKISKDIGDIIFLKTTCSVNLKLDCNPKQLLQEMLELGLSGVFSDITSAFRNFVSSGEPTFSALK